MWLCVCHGFSCVQINGTKVLSVYGGEWNVGGCGERNNQHEEKKK